MTSLTEVVLTVRFRPDTPLEVLGVFAEWLDDDLLESLPSVETVLSAKEIQVVEDVFDDLLDDEVVRRLSPLQQVVGVRWLLREGLAYYSELASVRLVHSDWAWTLVVRGYAKRYPDDLQCGLRWLGRYTAFDPETGQAELIGYLKHEYDERPILVWHVGAEAWRFEDLGAVPLPPHIQVPPPPPEYLSPEQLAQLREAARRFEAQIVRARDADGGPSEQR